MELFGNYKPVELLLSIRNFNMTLEASTTLNSGANFQYLRTLVHGEALNQIGTLSSEVGSATPENLLSISLVLGTYVFPIDVMFKQKSAMRRGMKSSMLGASSFLVDTKDPSVFFEVLKQMQSCYLGLLPTVIGVSPSQNA